MHTTDEEIEAAIQAMQPVVHTTELPIRVITVIPLPCGHQFPQPVYVNTDGDTKERKKFDAQCFYCERTYYVDIQPDVCEMVRIK
jgi:hypothetical protein